MGACFQQDGLDVMIPGPSAKRQCFAGAGKTYIRFLGLRDRLTVLNRKVDGISVTIPFSTVRIGSIGSGLEPGREGFSRFAVSFRRNPRDMPVWTFAGIFRTIATWRQWKVIRTYPEVAAGQTPPWGSLTQSCNSVFSSCESSR